MPDIIETKTTEIKQKFVDKIEECLVKELKQIDRTIESIVRQSILSLIGVIKSDKGYEVDHWNKRTASLTTYIDDKVQEKIYEIIGPYVDKELKRLMNLKTLKASISKRVTENLTWSFEQSFKSQVAREIEALGEKMGKRISNQIQEALADVGKFDDDILNPEAFQGKLGEFFLEVKAEKIAKGLNEQ